MKRLLTVFLLASAVSAADTLVIAPKEFHGALTPWLKHRRAQGHDVEVQVPQADLRKQVRTAHGHYAGRLRFLVLVGDVKRIPCTYSPGVIIKPYERDPRIANDNAIADVDGDHLPDLAVGRVPADSAAEARAMLARAIAFETDQDFGAWRRRINVVAGTGGFGPALDAILEGVATNFLSKSVPAAYDLHVTYANENSPFCPPPSRLSET
ncbi:MAG: C25 family cysteine peptidase, partial [Planctomycetota bacterium]|nr:C25 family cysteine peptidase [Planctomycetota bacterium]